MYSNFLLEKHVSLRMAVGEDSVGYNRKETLEKESHFLKIGGPFFIPFSFWSTPEDSIGF